MAQQPNKQYAQQVTIKSKYFNSQEQRKIIISPEKSQISISHPTNPQAYKDFHIDQLQSHQILGNRVVLNFDNGRKYQIQTQQPHHLKQALIHTRNLQLSNKFVDQSISLLPKPLNYCQAMNPLLNLLPGASSAMTINRGHLDRQSEIQGDTKEMISKGVRIGVSFDGTDNPTERVVSRIASRQQKPRQLRMYSSQAFFKNPADWKITSDQGNVVILNEEWKSNATKIVGFLVKKFISTGSFMGLSFPVFAMQPESILQTYAKSIASAPKILTRTPDPIQRIKQFVFFLWTVSLLQVTLLKPFNPVIGETFQADINGGRYSAEQVSHHPPVSAFYYQKDNYKIHGALQLSASIGLNSGEGRFIGDITISYEDGHWIKGRLPNGQITGILFGQTAFRAYGGAYVYDSRNLVLTYQLGSSKNFQGYLGMLNYKSAKHFQEVLKNPDRFIKFKAYDKDSYSKILSTFTGRYSNWHSYDGKELFRFDDIQYFPFIIEKPLDGEYQLKSDSSFRADTDLLKQGEIDKSQEEKERIENQERVNRKLREKYHG